MHYRRSQKSTVPPLNPATDHGESAVPASAEATPDPHQSVKIPLGISALLATTVLAASPFGGNLYGEQAAHREPHVEAPAPQDVRLMAIQNEAVNLVPSGTISLLQLHRKQANHSQQIDIHLTPAINDAIYHRLQSSGGDWLNTKFIAHPLPKAGESPESLIDTPLTAPDGAELMSGDMQVSWQFQPTEAGETREYAIAHETTVSDATQDEKIKQASAGRVFGVVKLTSTHDRIVSAEFIDEPALPNGSVLLYTRVGDTYKNDILKPEDQE